MLILFQQCSPKKQFTEMSASETGIRFRNQITETEHNNIMTYEYMYNGAGVATGDLNQDGLPDLYLVGNSMPNKLYVNKGQWKFEDITETSGTGGRPDWKTGITMADVNGDGWLDLYLCYSGNTTGERLDKPVIRDHPGRANQLFINRGCEPGGIPTFTESAKAYGLDAIGTFSTQSYFFDYDRDGDLDMFLLNHANMFYAPFYNVKKLRALRHPYFGNKLYRNEGEHFVEVSEAAGIHGSGLNFGLSAAISDLNGDHWPDLYVTNDYDEQDFCYVNNGDGTFREVSHTLFGHLSKYGMGSDIADINNDGLPDVYVVDMLPEDNHRQKLLKGADEYDKVMLAADSGYHFQYMRNTLQLNRGLAPDSLPRFSEVAQLSGISNTDWSWAPLLADFDNDGLRDLFTTNGYLRDYTNQDFLKYKVSDALQKTSKDKQAINVMNLIQTMPATKLKKYIFRNTDGLHFQNVTEAWGLTQETISNGTAYADFDNDGDLDLVVNNLNDEVTLLQNHAESIQQHHYIKLRLDGRKPNKHGIGAAITITLSDGRRLFQEAHFSRGYQSSVEPVMTIGIGNATFAQQIDVRWPDGTQSIQALVTADRLVVIDQATSAPVDADVAMPRPALLTDVTARAGLRFRHRENTHIDFKYQRLLLAQLSRLGGKLAIADVNGDGNDDVFFAGASGQPRKLYLGTNDGHLIDAPQQPWDKGPVLHEDTGMTFFDADGDGDVDLYLVSGGNEFSSGDPFYQDRLYLNDGKGVFQAAFTALPSEQTSGSCVIASDYDHDGDLDLFVGGRLAAQQYPLFPKSYLLRNDTRNGQVKFTDVTETAGHDLSRVGMVTDARWADINRDGWADLIVVGEWMPVSIFINQQGSLAPSTQIPNPKQSRGWWCAITDADVDGDGDVDFLLGNAGLNMALHASTEEPIECFMQDINGDGAIDPIVCSYIQGKRYPHPSRDELLDQVTPLRKRFIRYADYADATIEDIVGADKLPASRVLQAETLASSWLENTGNGELILKPLPAMAQLSSIQDFHVADFDGDGVAEVLAAGNFYPYRAQFGRCDAFTGCLLKFEHGVASLYATGLPLWLTGDIRDLAMMHFRQGGPRLVVSRNDDYASLYALTPRTDTR
ncbi:VCBS repeat-containing protein [Fulvivirgaceae bacterium PWU5]|uniref:VCBS repeat-containing protein n=2 Tax=Dawidia cretensis TaxID=2782350 RepID=A0AAP2GUZ8_9BACT|nr:VCBS repeat-containing protein [Dawidia cretensis]